MMIYPSRCDSLLILYLYLREAGEGGKNSWRAALHDQPVMPDSSSPSLTQYGSGIAGGNEDKQ